MITSAVEMMKVTVEMRTMESEKRARNWARFEVQGYLKIELKSSIFTILYFYSIVFHSQLRHLPHSVLPKSSSAA